MEANATRGHRLAAIARTVPARQRRPAERTTQMDYKLELVAVPVSDVDRAKAFYTEQVGFHADLDHAVSDDMRFVQLTPPGSGCSIAIGKGIVDGAGLGGGPAARRRRHQRRTRGPPRARRR